jgi:hypothetical protein
MCLRSKSHTFFLFLLRWGMVLLMPGHVHKDVRFSKRECCVKLFVVACRRQLQQEFLDRGVLSSLKNWLEPLPDGSLPNINIRTGILKLLTDVS